MLSDRTDCGRRFIYNKKNTDGPRIMMVQLKTSQLYNGVKATGRTLPHGPGQWRHTSDLGQPRDHKGKHLTIYSVFAV